jgi:hypothetical protein
MKYPQGEEWARAMLGNERYLSGDLVAARAQVSEAVALCRRHDDLGIGSWTLELMARIALADGERAEASNLLTEAINRAIRRHGRLDRLCRSVAVLAAAYGDFRLCARLLGCRAAMQEREDLLPWDALDVSWAQGTARQQLGDDAFVAAHHHPSGLRTIRRRHLRNRRSDRSHRLADRLLEVVASHKRQAAH